MPPPGFAPSAAPLPSRRASAFTAPPAHPAATPLRPPARPRPVAAPARRLRQPRAQLGSPSIQIGRPKTSIRKSAGVINNNTAEPEPEAGKGAAKARPRRKTQADEVPMYKVILLGDEEYVEAHVVTQLQKICNIQKQEATRIFHEAQQTGSSIVCVVCEEHAEFYAQQLKRQEIFVTIEKDE